MELAVAVQTSTLYKILRNRASTSRSSTARSGIRFTFERSLITLGAPFDRYLRGELDAISPEAERGYELFESLGCSACHQGVNVGANLFQRFGVFPNPFPYRPVTRTDLGPFTLTGNTKDRWSG